MEADKTKDRTISGSRVTYKIMFANLLLAILKMGAGILTANLAVITDAVHSVSDIFSNLLRLLGIKLSSEKSGKVSPGGHRKLEGIFSKLVALLLFGTAIALGLKAVQQIFEPPARTAARQNPDFLLIGVTGFSVLVQESLFHFTQKYAKFLCSPFLEADAWHQRINALASFAVLLGLVCSFWLHWHWLEAAAGLLVTLLILKVSIETYITGEKQMRDPKPDKERMQKTYSAILRLEGVAAVEDFKFRLSGNCLTADAQVLVSSSLSFEKAEELAQKVELLLQEEFTAFTSTLRISSTEENPGEPKENGSLFEIVTL